LSQELYSHYTHQVKDTCASLADPHKAYLLRKAMHYFNTQRQHRQEAHDKPLIEDLVADDISPGVQLSTMLADILEDASSLHSLSLANNHMEDSAVANIMRALAANGDVQLTNLDLSGNNLLAPVSAFWAHACMWLARLCGRKASWLSDGRGGELVLGWQQTGTCSCSSQI
jgi:hypothetical protein